MDAGNRYMSLDTSSSRNFSHSYRVAIVGQHTANRGD